MTRTLKPWMKHSNNVFLMVLDYAPVRLHGGAGLVEG